MSPSNFVGILRRERRVPTSQRRARRFALSLFSLAVAGWAGSSADARADESTAPAASNPSPTAGEERGSAWQMPPATPQPAPGLGNPQGYVAPSPIQPQPGYPPAPQAYRYPPQGPTFHPPPDQGEEPEDEEEPSPPFFDVAAMTIVPLSLGGQLSLEIPGRVLLQGDVGWMPGFYGSAINGLVSSFGAYDSEVASLVEGALDDAVVVRVSAGWRPFPDAGFELTGGYTLLSVSGEVSVPELAAVVGGELAGQTAAELGVDSAEIDSQLHNFHVALGWRWVALEHLVIRAQLGYTQTLGSSSSVTIDGQPEATALANPVVDSTLDDTYTSYVKLPYLAVGVGYRF